MNCPKCKAVILPSNINISKDIAACHVCDFVFAVSEYIHEEEDETFQIENPPAGAWIRHEYNGIVIGATTRSKIAWFLVPFMTVWSGGSIGGIYGSQFLTGEFDLMLSLFGIPFILGSFLFWGFTLMAILGKVELRINDEEVNVFTGFGTIGLKSRFLWGEVSRITESNSNFRYPGNTKGTIQVDGAKRVTFGSGLSENRKYFLLQSLLKLWKDKKQKKRLF